MAPGPSVSNCARSRLSALPGPGERLSAPWPFLTQGAWAAGPPASACGMKLVFPVAIWVPASQLCPPQSQAQEAEPHLINTGELEKPQRPEGEYRTAACLLLVHSIYLLLFFLLQIRVAGAPSPQPPAPSQGRLPGCVWLSRGFPRTPQPQIPTKPERTEG